MSGVVIRPARASDLPALNAIEQSGAETFARYGEPLADGSPPTPPGHWEAVLAEGLLWVAADPTDGPVGFLAGERLDEGLLVAEVDVRETHQQRGIGRRLMQAAIDRARADGLADVTLTTFRHIPWNAPFYRSLGFVEIEPDALPASLAAILADEASNGFEDRCAMRLAL